MTAVAATSLGPDSFSRRHPVLAYFLLTFALSWTGALAVAAPDLLRGREVSKLSGILMFPAMLLGPSIGGIVMTGMISGREGLKELFARLRRWRVPARWYGVLLMPPVLVLGVLYILRTLVSPAFSPSHFYWGILFGVPAGILEEIGWMGYAFPKMSSRLGPFAVGIALGMVWAVWHLPVINFLGAAAPHGAYWPHFFLAFALAMTAMRVLISWLYINTKSVLLAQLMHISSTGALVIFSPPVGAAREAMWYAVYGCALWMLVGVIVARRERGLQS